MSKILYSKIAEVFENMGNKIDITELHLRYPHIYKNLIYILNGSDLKLTNWASLNSLKYIGGNYNIKIPEYDDSITIIEESNEKGTLYKIYSKKLKDEKMVNDENNPCLVMIHKANSKTIEIGSINAYTTCLTEKNKRVNGTVLLHFALTFIDTIKDKEKIRRIILTDEAELTCNNRFVPLSHLKFIISGYGWYQSPEYGFEPAKYSEGKYVLDTNKKQKYNEDREKIKMMKIIDSKILEIIKKKIEKYSNKKEIFDSLIELQKYFEENKNEYLSVVLKKYFRKDKFKERCLALSIIIDNLFEENRFSKYQGKVFIKNI